MKQNVDVLNLKVVAAFRTPVDIIFGFNSEAICDNISGKGDSK
jgi:hypothetical protein